MTSYQKPDILQSTIGQGICRNSLNFGYEMLIKYEDLHTPGHFQHPGLVIIHGLKVIDGGILIAGEYLVTWRKTDEKCPIYVLKFKQLF